MDDDLQDRVQKAVAEVLDQKGKEIPLNASLRDDLGFDSLKQMTLFILLEDELQLSIPPEEATGIETVQDIIDFINKKTKKSSPT
jgi:acyl carrier protein